MPARAHQVRALAPRRVAVGRLGSRDCALLAAQTLAAAGHDPGPGRKGLRIDCVGVFPNGGRLARSLSGASLALKGVSESPGPGRACPPALVRASTGLDPASSESLGPGRTCSRAPSLDRHGPRPSTSELQDSVGRAAARGTAGRVPAAHTPTAETQTPRLFGPGRPGLLAGASPRAGGWAQIRINSDIARRAMRRLVCADRSRLRPKQSNAARDCRDYSDTKPFAARCIPTCATCLFTGRALSVSPASSLSCQARAPARVRVLVPRSLQRAREREEGRDGGGMDGRN